MVTTKFYIGFIFFTLTVGTLFFNSTFVNEGTSSINYPGYFDQWRPDNATMASLDCGCHIPGGNSQVYSIYGKGTIDVQGSTSVNQMTPFVLGFKVSGFTDANNGLIVIGLNRLDENNSLFTNNQTVDQTSIAVDASGNSQYVNLSLTAPTNTGNYSLLAYAVYGDSHINFNYLAKTIPITVLKSDSNPTGSTSDITTYKVYNSINIDDQKLDPTWTSVSGTPVAEFGTGGYIKSVQDGVYIYTLLAYEPTLKWIAIDFNVNNSNQYMGANQDAWVIGNGQTNSYHGDYYFTGMSSSPTPDSRNDVFYEIIQTESLNYIETARLLNTQDTAGKDFTFVQGKEFNVAFASDVDHTGSHQILTWSVTDILPTGGNVNTNGLLPNLKQAFNMAEISDYVFVISFVIVIVTVFLHISLRVVSRPITHEKRIIYTDKIPNHPSSTTLIKNFLFKPKDKVTEEKK